MANIDFRNIESVQYNSTWASTVTIKGSSHGKLYQELKLQYLHQGRWVRPLCLLDKVFWLSNHHLNILRNIFLLMPLINGLNLIQVFVALVSHNLLVKFIATVKRKTFNINEPLGTKMLKRLRFGFSHLRKHKFDTFKDTLVSFYSCSIETETATHYFLCCHFYDTNLMNDFQNVTNPFSVVIDNNLINLFYNGDAKFDDFTEIW